MKNKLIVLLPTALTAFMTSSTFANSLESLKGHDIIGDEFWGSKHKKEENVVAGTNLSLSNLKASSVEKSIKEMESGKINEVRRQTLENAALSYGAVAGLARGSYIINKKLDSYNKDKDRILDKTYNFERIQLEKGLLPPVISEGRDAYNKPSENEVRAADKIYKIETPAKIVSAVPDWRVYLYVEANEPEMPAKAVLPKTRAEEKIWDEYVKRGWDQGLEQAGDLYDNNKARLDRDFSGMVKYKILYEQNMVSKPKLVRTDLGVTGGGNEMSIGDRIIKKVSEAELNPQSNKWFKKK